MIMATFNAVIILGISAIIILNVVSESGSVCCRAEVY